MRFAIIGTGAIGQEHLRNLLLMSKREEKSKESVSVAALCDSTPLSLELAKMTLGLVTPSPDALRSLGLDERSAAQVSHVMQVSRPKG